MIITAWIVLIVIVLWVAIEYTLWDSWKPILVAIALLLTLFILTSCSPRVTDPCVTARPPVIGGGLMDTVGVVDSGKGGCE